MMRDTVVVTGAFDDVRSRDLRFLEEAAKLGPLTVVLWTDETIRNQTGKLPRFPEAERLYFLRAVRFVGEVVVAGGAAGGDEPPKIPGVEPVVWAVRAGDDSAAKRACCEARGMRYRVFGDADLAGFPAGPGLPPPSIAGRKKVIVTGCYDWFHSGHVRFFEEVGAYGDLYVVVGHDANIRLLKGEGHPLLPQEERRYVAGCIRYVTRALVSTGSGWLDAEPEILRLKPDIYAVNEDGDKGGKREYCERLGIQYLVLRRAPAPGLPRRSSTDLRGF
jgi:cytidyltransferase-like protein